MSRESIPEGSMGAQEPTLLPTKMYYGELKSQLMSNGSELIADAAEVSLPDRRFHLARNATSVMRVLVQILSIHRGKIEAAYAAAKEALAAAEFNIQFASASELALRNEAKQFSRQTEKH